MNGRALILVLLALAGVASGCGGTSVTQITAPDPVRCDISLAASSASVPASGTQLSVPVSAQRDCTWNAQSDASWVQVAPTSGQGDGALTVNVSANSGQDSRSGSVTIGDVVYQVVQAGNPAPPPHCAYLLLPPSRSVGDRGGNREVRVFAPSDCPWTAVPTVDWIHVLDGSSGTGSAIVRYSVDRNRSDDSRVGTIVIGGQDHTVRQDGD